MNQWTGPRQILSRILYPFFVITGDCAAFYLSLGLSYFLRVYVFKNVFPLPFVGTFGDLSGRLWMPLVVIIVFAYEGLYTKREPFWEETRTVLRALFLSFLGIFSIVSLGKLSSEISRVVVIGTGIFSLALVPLFRYRWKPFLHGMGVGVKKTILIGDNPVGHLAHLGIFRDHYMGIRLVGFIKIPGENVKIPMNHEEPYTESEEESLSGFSPPPLSCLGTLENLSDIVRREVIRGAVIAMPYLRREEMVYLIECVQRSVLSVYIVPNLTQVSLLNSELLYLFYEEIFLLGIHNNLKSRVNRWIKSFFDGVLASLLFIPLAPIMGAIAIIVALTSPGPVLFSQWRVGRDGKPFRIFKFRTMYLGAELLLEKILKEDPLKKKEFEEKHKLSDDPRITPVGRFLRRTSLDELPQVFNVLKGEMSLVGPRPVTQNEIDLRYREAGEDYCLVKPGMTGLWQVSGRNERDYNVRVRLDLWYIRNWSLWLDLVILVRTAGVVLVRRGAF